MSSSARPDPDALLAQLQREEAHAARGRLKIFFGACAGVGKTFAMLNAARARQQAGVSVLIGVVETHGRQETEAQLLDLPLLPRRVVEYQGRQLSEFDLDAALQAAPQLMLIDEFAHANLPGSRHAKRWQDVEELLAAGIDVYTTLNVQHLESLNDIVGQITGIVVRETVPDKVFDAANEVTLVDLPPEELLDRLAAGKVYLGAQAERAAQHFFRKGNLLALRELALRRTADRVDAQMRAYRADQAIQPVWQARERLLVCVGPGAAGEKLVRSAARLAASLHADWLAVYVETPALLQHSKGQRERVLSSLRLAQELGAETSVLAGSSLVTTLLAYARSRNVSKLVLGRPHARHWRTLWRRSLSERLAEATPDIDVYVVAEDPLRPGERPQAPQPFYAPVPTRSRWTGYAGALGACCLTTLLSLPLLHVFDPANVVIVFLLAVVLVAIRWGRGPGMAASILSVLTFDFFFVAPKLSFTVSDTQYLFTFVLMLVVALVISQLAARLRFEAQVATYRERRTRALYELGRELASALTSAGVVEIGQRKLAELFGGQSLLLLPNASDELQAAGELGEFDPGLADWVFRQGEPAGWSTRTLPAAKALYLPLKAPMRLRGVLALQPGEAELLASPEQQRLLETCASQIAVSLERVHYVEVAQDAIVAMEGERLRNSVLAAVSHDLRTPLTRLAGLVSLLQAGEGLQAGAGAPAGGGIHSAAAEPALRLSAEQQRQTLATLADEVQRMNQLVLNLLEMARLQSGVVLQLEWHVLEEVIGSAVRACASQLAGHQLQIQLQPDLPLVEYDVVLIERVLVNWLENAAKYTPAGSTLVLSAHTDADTLCVRLRDNGPGLPPGAAERLFDKFTRGHAESATPGVGLGLAICRAIIEAHHGQISARNVSPQGAEFEFRLPRRPPPALTLEPPLPLQP
ncbi:sensor histidine kinase KdpD [Chitinibacter tainanensis]|uniref:sensor histidine kinase n=1 Tax=Chitinibacter tainanensis TaxID=230667 RepID=UPI0023544152|nr:sensor histidine kinase KdpD [Chitinibacter tainanensis]